MRAWLFVIVGAGCSYAPARIPASGDGPAVDDDAPASTNDGTIPAALVDRGLVARYFVAEATTGQSVPALLDSTPNAVNMPITYVGADPAFVETNGHRGLQWSGPPGGPARAEVVAQNTKLRADLVNRTAATIEIVADVQEAIDTGSRLFHLGEPGDSSLDFRIVNTTTVDLFWDGPTERTIAFTLDPPSPGRAVYHAVFDFAAADADDRVRIYRAGIRQQMLAPGPPGGDVITLPDLATLGCSFGNRQDATRSFRGVLYYGAIYNVAFDATEIAMNVAYLDTNDDG